ncbi:MAG: PD-(D/E)XK nuclease domain-containing protein [Turicibacter sp.]|nr:PD-(D/E)XK nuclease domain-containing protein [Turicibacter sp.]
MDRYCRSHSKIRKALAFHLKKESQAVAQGIEEVHDKNLPILIYNDENSLRCVLSLALYAASQYYTVIHEMPAGKGFADLVFMPRPSHLEKPAMVVELKYGKTVEGAIDQIKKRSYPIALEGYHGNLLLVGINYDKESKVHECLIEEFVK